MTWITRVAKAGTVVISTLGLGGSLGVNASCGGPPRTQVAQDAFVMQADATLEAMKADSESLANLVDSAYGYVVFPRISKGGLIIGGAHGNGVVYRRGQPIGLVELNQASIGAQLGGQSFSEVIVFQTAGDLEELLDGRFSLGANAAAVLLSQGGTAAVEFKDGVAVAVKTRGGLMLDLSVSGQVMNYRNLTTPRG